jgi:hypothetical protein
METYFCLFTEIQADDVSTTTPQPGLLPSAIDVVCTLISTELSLSSTMTFLQNEKH